MKPTLIAQVAYEVNRAYCAAIGDHSFVEWKDAPDWQKETNIKGVEYKLANPDATPEQMHNSWLAVKEAEGWKYGPVKNPETKEHPCYLPYAELPLEQRVKDYLFSAVVMTLAGAAILVDVNALPGNSTLLNESEKVEGFVQKAVVLDEDTAKAKQKAISQAFKELGSYIEGLRGKGNWMADFQHASAVAQTGL